jgi:hypothetical protein
VSAPSGAEAAPNIYTVAPDDRTTVQTYRPTRDACPDPNCPFLPRRSQ